MIQEELLKELSQSSTKDKIVRLAQMAAKSSGYIPELLELCFYPKSQIAFRASWILEHVAENEPLVFFQFLEDFLRKYPRQNNQSCRRHFTKIVMSQRQITRYSDSVVEPVVDSTFQWLIDPATPVAVKVNCLDILLMLSKRYDWIGEELKPQIELLLKDGSAAMQSRGKRVLAKLGR